MQRMMSEHQGALRDLSSMWRIRLFEEKVRELRQDEAIVGSVHLCIGQEAVAVGACGTLLPQDAVFATYRGHGWALARGTPLLPLFGELLGRASGASGGRGGSAHFTAPEWGFFGENSIVGAAAPIAVGAALAATYDGSGRVAMCVFGDGAMNQGSVHEAFNFAAAFKLPVVFVCENNYWSELTPIVDMVANPNLYERAAGYGMPGCRVDGNDASQVRSVVGLAVERARDGVGPSLVEAMTQRLVGHYIGDAEQYRRPGEIDAAMRAEPIGRVERELREAGIGRAALEQVRSKASDEVDAALEEALTMPLADPSSVRDHLYA